MIKVSVILPVYNVAQYLYHSLSCLINQTLKDIEIICVDDGSTDESVKILNEFATKDERIKIILNKHSFAGTARNTGLQAAQGEYIVFFDPDDYCDVMMLEKLYQKISSDKTDMLITGIYSVEENKISYYKPSFQFRVNDLYNNKVFTIDDIKDDLCFFMVYPYNKIYRKDFLDKNAIKFQEISNTNDASFAYETLFAADKISMTNEMYYYYREYRQGNTRLTKGKNLQCVIDAYEYSYDVCSTYANFDTAKNGFYAIIISSLIHHIHTYCKDYEQEKTFFYNYARNYIEKHFINNKKVQNLLKTLNYFQYIHAFLIFKNNYKKYTKILNNKEKIIKHKVGCFDYTLKFLKMNLYKHYYNTVEGKEKYNILGIEILKYKLKNNILSKYIFGIKVSKKAINS